VIELVIKVIACYLLGSVVGSLIVGRLRGGVDIRQLGSGNAGGTNALRTQGTGFALCVVLIDVAKGFIATQLIATASLPGIAAVAPAWREWMPVACGLATVLGHVYPAWYGFRGGKGAATLVGVLLGIEPLLLLAVALTWLAVVAIWGFIGLASMVAIVTVPAWVAWSGAEPRAPLLTFGVAAAVLVALTHRSNIARMRAGTEPRARRLWLLGRRRA
jgi:glycerol-3-phosphate acyltransferase PlsY